MKKLLTIFILSCVFILKIHAQLGFCAGSSGDSIFTETFGTGTSYGPPLPVGTTTYAYVGFGGPQDGQYTVGSSTFEYGWNMPTDHTPGDTNGKALIVNASFTSGEFYTTTINGLCENTSYEFSSWLINILPSSGCAGNGIPVNVSFEIWDSSDTILLASGNTGDIPSTTTPIWGKYGLVFTTTPGQFSVILKMKNNGIGGCGNDLAIDDIEFKTCGDTITVTDILNNSAVSLCSGETPFATTLTAIPDNTVFSNHFYQWQESTDGVIWTDIIGATTQNLIISGITTTIYYRSKVAEFAANLSNADCITFSDIYEVIINQAPSPPTTDCWETATLNNTTCLWEVTGTQPAAPTGLDCWETAAFNTTTCLWEVTGTQPTAPTGLDCWETATFNNTTCLWEVTGTQPTAPGGLDCWEIAAFNTTTCLWEVTGTQPTAPTGLDCWETATFNTTTCLWEVTGTQPTVPTGLDCWETSAFNITTCLWEVTGTQPAVPTGLDCWETATFNTATCLWEVTGTQPAAPTGLDCWETSAFNITTCLWEVTGTQPNAPTGLDCWEIATFNTITCLWEVTGTQPPPPTGLECWETAIFNNTTCIWDIEGEEPIDTIEEFVVLCEDGTVILSANSNLVNPSFLWSTGEITEEIIVTNPGTYAVEITDNTCITIIKTIDVSLIESPQIESVFSEGSDIIIEMLNTGDFEYSLDGVQYQTSNVFSNAEGGLYIVYVRELNGCGIDTTNHLHFKIPKFFTPNNDGIHDAFSLNGIEYFSNSEVYIYDRYGKLLKSAKNQPFNWDGTFNNQELPSSDYWYVIKIDNQVFRGHFTLKR